MSYVINTNTNAMNAQINGFVTNRHLSASLNKLSSGLQINKAADNASGLAISDSLRSQATGLGQAIKNANDAIGIIQIADKAMDEQVKILDTIRVKAIQSAQDGQTANSRKAIQSDIVRLLEELDNIAKTTTYNGKSLLAGGFSNRKFQIGAYSNETVNASIGATSSDKIGQTRFETGAPITAPSNLSLRMEKSNGVNDIDLESVIISTSAGTGLGALADVINKRSNELETRAKAEVELTGIGIIGPKKDASGKIANTILGLYINDISLGDINDIRSNDNDAKLTAAINNVTANTGVQASVNAAGSIVLTTVDGRGIKISADKGLNVIGIPGTVDKPDLKEYEYYGRLTVIRNDARDVLLKVIDTESTGRPSASASSIGFGANGNKYAPSETVINLRAIRGTFTPDQASAIGQHASYQDIDILRTQEAKKMPTGVTTFVGSQAVIDISDTATRMLNKIRSDLGSVQIQLEATVTNIATTRTNVKFSESQIRDVDYATEIANFKKYNILAQAGNYALSQSNSVAQNVLKLLQ